MRKSIDTLNKLYRDDKGKADNSKIVSSNLEILNSPSLKRIFTEKKALADIQKRIGGSLTKSLTSIESLKSLSDEALTVLLKSNAEKLLWNNLTTSLNKMKGKDKEPATFNKIIDNAKEIVPDIKTVNFLHALKFVEKLDKKNYQQFIERLDAIENKPDWLKELQIDYFVPKIL